MDPFKKPNDVQQKSSESEKKAADKKNEEKPKRELATFSARKSTAKPWDYNSRKK